ncbi:MAG: response regulator [Deltaproteobacteria bacterium]|nr:response regulator [Deltaproteobacteria bacterium]
MTKDTGINQNFFTILMADDDPDDRFIAEQAFLELGFFGELRFVKDGEELMHYLRRSGKYSDPLLSSRPTFILLDLNMPKKHGWQALVEIKADPDLQDIPVVIWTTSKETEDTVRFQKTGADVFVTKPADYGNLLNSLHELVAKYCFS